MTRCLNWWLLCWSCAPHSWGAVHNMTHAKLTAKLVLPPLFPVMQCCGSVLVLLCYKQGWQRDPGFSKVPRNIRQLLYRPGHWRNVNRSAQWGSASTLVPHCVMPLSSSPKFSLLSNLPHPLKSSRIDESGCQQIWIVHGRTLLVFPISKLEVGRCQEHACERRPCTSQESGKVRSFSGEPGSTTQTSLVCMI